MESRPVNGSAITYHHVAVRAAHASSLDVIGNAFGSSQRPNTVPEVRFSSDRTIYIERLVDGHWCGRYWMSALRSAMGVH